MNPYERIDQLETQMRQVLLRLEKLERKGGAALLEKQGAGVPTNDTINDRTTGGTLHMPAKGRN